MLALSSYKMKKYGECLFAVSKAATAMLKRERLDGSKPMPKARLAGAAERDDVSLSPVKSETRQYKGTFGETATAAGLALHDLEDGTGDSSQLTFDGEGNLTRLGHAQLVYLKAKCLCKLQRYSESLFQLAKIKQMSQNEFSLLSERKQNKMQLYRAICMMHTKQYKQAVQILNTMLARVAPEQDDLFENMRESHVEKRKPLAALLIQAYSCRGRANEHLQDYWQALDDYNKLIELCQFQDLPTEKVFEYMNSRSVVLAKLSGLPKVPNEDTAME